VEALGGRVSLQSPAGAGTTLQIALPSTAPKVLSAKDDPVAGVLAGLRRLAETAGVDLPAMLQRTERFGHGTTIGTNAVLERRGARVGLVATAGHGDALAMMRGAGRVAGRSIEGVFSVHGSRLPAPLIVPGAVVKVQERVDASGNVVAELDTDAAVGRITRMIAEYELDSVAVALLWSFANPAHEKALAEAIPEAFVTVTGRAVLAPASGNFKDGCAVLERPLRTVAPEFATREGRAGYLVRYREYLCPVTGLRVDSEIIADGDEALHDIVIGRPSA
jgi:hypothetical protein